MAVGAVSYLHKIQARHVAFVSESGMIVSGDSLPVSSAKKCEKSKKLLAGKQVN